MGVGEERRENGRKSKQHKGLRTKCTLLKTLCAVNDCLKPQQKQNTTLRRIVIFLGIIKTANRPHELLPIAQ
jgi:hypothetical protein